MKLVINRKSIRSDFGYTMEQMADMLDVKPNTYKAYENESKPNDMPSAVVVKLVDMYSQQFGCTKGEAYSYYYDGVKPGKTAFQADNDILKDVDGDVKAYVMNLMTELNGAKSEIIRLLQKQQDIIEVLRKEHGIKI